MVPLRLKSTAGRGVLPLNYTDDDMEVGGDFMSIFSYLRGKGGLVVMGQRDSRRMGCRKW